MQTRERTTSYARPGEGRALRVPGGQLLTLKVTAEQTGGAYSLFEGAVSPQSGARPHIHHREDECFCVLEGEFEFSREGETIRAGAGSLVYVPRGCLHAFTNVGEGTGRLLLSQTPGGLQERFFEEVAEGSTAPGPEVAPDPERVAAIAARYGTEIPAPNVAGGSRP